MLLGVARCLPEHHGGDWARSLAVHPVAPGRGIGLALLREAFRVFHARGDRIVALYERAGMAVGRAADVWERPAAKPPAGLADGPPAATEDRRD